MEKYTKPVMEVEFFGRDIIATSGTGCSDELPIVPFNDPEQPDFD